MREGKLVKPIDMYEKENSLIKPVLDTCRGSGAPPRQGDDVGLPLQSGGSRAPTDENVPVEEARILVRPARASVVGQIYKFTKFTVPFKCDRTLKSTI